MEKTKRTQKYARTATRSQENLFGSPRKVRVKGITKVASEDAILYYFENRRRSGGGDIKDIIFNYEEDTAEIIFENLEDAIAVTKKDHTINGKNVDVTLCTVPQKRPMYEDKVLIKGLKEEISDECLIYFLDAKAGIKTKSLTYHKEGGSVVLVTAHSQIDFATLRDGNQKFILEGATIAFSPVKVTNCIYVENLPKDVSEDFLEIYFDNVKRSNGGPVRNVEMSADHRSCLVYFEDHTVVDSVLEKKHRLSDQTLEVRKFYECVGCPEEVSITLPPPIVIGEMNIEKLKFVQKTYAYKAKLEHKLDICHAKIDWSELDGEVPVLKIGCTADLGSLLSNRLQNRWRKRTEEIFEKVLDKVGVNQRQLKSTEVEACLETIRSIDGTTDIKCDFDEEKEIVKIVGNVFAVNLASKYIDVTITAQEQAVKNTKLRVVFSSEAEMNMIQKLEEFTQLNMDFPNVKIHVSMTEYIVELEGSANEVNSVKMILCDVKNTLITVFSDPLPRLSERLYTLPQTVEFISEGLMRKKLIASWCVSDQKLMICCRKEVLDRTVNTVKSAVVQNEILICPESTSLTVTDIWSEKLEEYDQLYNGKVIVSFDDSASGTPKIEVCATADLAPKLFDDITRIIATKSEKLEKKKEPDYSLGSEEEYEAKMTTVLVSNIPADITEEFVKHFFEQLSHDTENVLEVKVDSKNKKAIVKFKDNNSIEYVMRREHKLCGKNLKVERCHDFLSTSEAVKKKCKPGDESLKEVDGSSELYREAQNILLGLSTHTFRTVVPQMQALAINSETELNGVVDIVFEKAISDQDRSVLYANLCRCLSMLKVPSDFKSGQMVNFQSVLIRRCQREFELNMPSSLNTTKTADDDERKLLRRNLNQREAKQTQRSLRHYRLFGELFKVKILSEGAIHDCIFTLLRTKYPADLECLCTLFTVVGKVLDVDKAKPRMDQYFQQISKLINNKTIPPYVKILLQDVSDLRMNRLPEAQSKNTKHIKIKILSLRNYYKGNKESRDKEGRYARLFTCIYHAVNVLYKNSVCVLKDEDKSPTGIACVNFVKSSSRTRRSVW